MKYSAQLTGLSYKFNNLDKLSQNKTMVVVANHQSMIDIIGKYSYNDVYWVKLVKLFLTSIFILGMFSKLFCYFQLLN